MKIAHLSDLHLSLDHHRGNSPRLRTALDHVARLNPDHIVVTGDLTWNARESEMRLVRRAFEEYGLFSAEKLSVIPGNHDVFGGVHTAEEALNFYSRCKWTPFEEGLAVFQRVFRDLFDGCLHASRKQLFPFVKILGDIALIGLNSVTRHSSLNNPFGSNGQVGRKQRERLALLLSTRALKDKRKIVLVHHHFHKPAWKATGVLSGLWLAFENKTMKLRKKQPLLRLLARNRVELVLHGHHHDNCEYTRNGIRFMNAGGTLMGPDPTMLSVNLAKVSEGDMRTEINHMPAEPPYLFVVTPQGEEFAAHAA